MKTFVIHSQSRSLWPAFLLAAAGPVLAQTEPIPLTLLGSWPGAATNGPVVDVRDVDVAGNHAYVANGLAGLEVLALGTMTNPVRVANYSNALTVRTVQVVGPHAYVVSDRRNFRSTLDVLDVSAPANPVRLGRYDAEGRILGFQVRGDLAYLAMAYGITNGPDLLFLSVAQPTNPVFAGSFTFNAGQADHFGLEVKVDHNVYLLVVVLPDDEESYEVLQILESGDPQPDVLGRVNYLSARALDRGLNSPDDCDCVYLAGSYTGLTIIDVDDEDHPTIVSRMFGRSFTGVRVQGNFAYVTTRDLEVLDLSNRTNVVSVGQYPLDAPDDGEEVRLKLLEDQILVANGAAGLLILGRPPRRLLEPWYPVAAAPGVTLNDVVFGADRFVAVGANGRVACSSNGVAWTNRFLSGNPTLTGVAHGKGVFVAVGPQTTVRTSANGLDWTERLAPAGMQAITFAAGQFLAVNGTSGIHVSSNGVNWQTRGTVATNALRSVAYGNNRFVAVGDRGTIVVSSNLFQWAAADSGTRSNLTDTTFATGVFVVVGAGGTVLWSADGVQWTRANAHTTADLARVAFGDGRFVAVGKTLAGDVGVAASRDGLTWAAEDLPVPPAGPAWNGIALGAGTCVLVGDSGSILLSAPVVRLDPSNGSVCAADSAGFSVHPVGGPSLSYQWQRNGTNIPGAISSNLALHATMPWDAGSYAIEVSDGLSTRRSLPVDLQVNLCPVLDHWTPVPGAASTQKLNSLTCSADQLVAVGDSGTILRSAGGVAWTPAASPTNAQLHAITFGDGLFVAVGNSGTILTSPDAGQWTWRNAGTNRNLRGVTHGAGSFVAVGDSGAVALSADGVTWSVSSLTNRALLAVHYADGLFVTSGGSGVLFTSPDGLEWTPRPSGVSLSLYSVTHGNGVWIAVGSGGKITRSLDGVDWTEVPSPTTAVLESITFAAGEFVAVGVGGVILSSPDGLAWRQRVSPTAADLASVVGCGHTLWAVGGNGVILQTGYHGPPQLTGARNEAGYHLTVTGEIATTYRLQTATNLPAETWLDLLTFTNFTPVTPLLDPTAKDMPQRFYRVVSP